MAQFSSADFQTIDVGDREPFANASTATAYQDETPRPMFLAFDGSAVKLCRESARPRQQTFAPRARRSLCGGRRRPGARRRSASRAGPDGELSDPDADPDSLAARAAA